MNETTKIVMVTSLIMVATISVASVVLVQSETTTDIVSSMDGGNSGEEIHEGLTFHIPPTPGTSAHDEWLDWYKTVELDAISDRARNAVLVAHDFEVMFDPDMDSDGSFLAIALLAQRDRLVGDYNPTTNEQLMHDWVINEHLPPTNISEIDDQLLTLVGSADNMHYAINLYETMTDIANIGIVPNALREQDWEYWNWELHIAACDLLFEDCDPIQLRQDLANNRELTKEELEWLKRELAEQENSDTAAVADGIIPNAYGLMTLPKHNYAHLTVWANSCTHQHTLGCVFQDWANGVGWNNLSADSVDRRDKYGDTPHTSGTIFYILSASANKALGALYQYVHIEAQFIKPVTSSTKTDSGTFGASVSDYWNPPGNNHSYSASGRTYASVTYN